MNAKLVIYDPTNSDLPKEVGIIAEIPVSITLSIADVKNPDQRNSSFSKTITLPGTQQINKIFEHIYNVNTILNTFNPNLKTRCKYFVRSEKVFDGDLQLLRIKKKGISPEAQITYEVSIVGRLANVFLDLGNSLLEDLDFSDLNHVFQYTNGNSGLPSQTSPTLGTGYVYPLIDYGVNGGNTSVWDFQHLSPAIFEKEYIDRIIEGIGKTYTSTYFNSTYGTSIVIPRNKAGALKMTNSQINAVSFYAGKTANTTSTTTLTFSNTNNIMGLGNPGWWQNQTQPQPLSLGVFNDDSTPPFYDGGGNYSTITGAYSAPSNNLEMKFSLKCDFEVRINAPLGTNGYYIVQTQGYAIDVLIIIPGGGTYGQTINVYPNYTTWTSVSVTVQVPYELMSLAQLAYPIFRFNDYLSLATVFTNSGTPIIAGTASIDVKLLKDVSWFSGTHATGNLPIGNTVDMNQCVPRNIKQIDFLMSVIKSENLYMELDLTDQNNYIIEKRSDFFLANSSALDWTSKWDFMNETEINPMGELDFRQYLFTYKADGDKYNKLYKDSIGEVYAQEQIYVENDFIKSQKKTELIFSPTPMVGNAVNTLVYPVFGQVDGTNIKSMDVNIRRLYWGGTKDTSFYGMVNALNGSQPTTLSIYPFAGTVDDPYTPTLSIDWGIPKILYYTYPAQTWTNNNLYVRNYKNFIDQITDENSKIVTMWIYLKPTDIANFSFRYPVWIRDSYYLVNKIMDYNPQEDRPTKVELLRLAYVEQPVVEDIIIWESGNGETTGAPSGIEVGGLDNANQIYSVSDGVVSGQLNVNNGSVSGIIGGFQNYIGGAINGT